MNRLCLSIAILFFVSCSSSKLPQGPQVPVAGYHLRYDHRALRIPGQKFAIGLQVPPDGKNAADTIGFPGKNAGWGKYHIEVDSGSYSGGKVKLRNSKVYKKGDSVTVDVYARKWFLGGRGKFLTSRKIPYNFEDSIAVMTSGNSGRFPGGHIQFGVRTFYDDKRTADLWYPVKKKNAGDFILGFDGGHLSRKKGDWKVDPDPTHIRNDEVKLFAGLTKAPAIRDTLGLLLDYKARFQCGILSNGDGDDLDVTVDVFNDTIIHALLMRVDVRDSTTHRTYHYLVNTQGGSINIASQGGAGTAGAAGHDGADGSDGADGAISQMPVTTTDTSGNLVTTYVEVQGPGGDGGSGGDGDNGENGYNGYGGGDIIIHYMPGAAPFLHLITASSFGGSGGAGGNGGAGGRGGSGGNGNPPGRPGHSGRDGISGSNGQNGSPGTVRFVAM